MVDFKQQYFAMCDAVYESWKTHTATYFDQVKKTVDSWQLYK